MKKLWNINKIVATSSYEKYVMIGLPSIYQRDTRHAKNDKSIPNIYFSRILIIVKCMRKVSTRRIASRKKKTQGKEIIRISTRRL